MSTDDLVYHLIRPSVQHYYTLPDHHHLSRARRWQCLWKNMSSETSDSFRKSKALIIFQQVSSKLNSWKEVTTGIAAPPAYFPMNVQMNRGVNLHRRGLRRGLTSIKPNAFKALAQDDDFLDVRTPQEFTHTYSWFRVRWTICTLGRCTKI
jgi:hypothetical protein